MRLQEELLNHAREAVSAGLTAIESGVHMYHDGPDLFFECTPASKAIVQKFMDDQSQDTADHRRLNRKDHRDYIEDLCMGLEDREDGQPSFHGPLTLTTGSTNISLYIDEEKGTIWYWAPGMNDFFWKLGVREMEFVRHCPYRPPFSTGHSLSGSRSSHVLDLFASRTIGNDEEGTRIKRWSNE